MKQQVDFALRVRTLNPGGINGGYTPEMLTDWAKKEYPFEQGWKLESVQHTQTSADGVSVLLVFTKWTEEVQSLKSK